VVVLIEESDSFHILMSSNDINDTRYQQTVLVPSEDGVTLLFPIKPTQLGEIPITAEGIEKSYSQSILLDLTDNKVQTTGKTLNFSFPPDTVNGSERVQITAIGNMQFWLSSAPTLSESWQPRSLDIEVAAYALLSYLQHRISEGIPVMRWLSRQRNSLGGFASTQDTVVALKALSEFSALMHTENTDIQVTVTETNILRPVHFRIDTQNRFLLHTAEVQPPLDAGIVERQAWKEDPGAVGTDCGLGTPRMEAIIQT
ncbi:hypothetical protein A6R68_23862, partial [Neotoma lepida]